MKKSLGSWQARAQHTINLILSCILLAMAASGCSALGLPVPGAPATIPSAVIPTGSLPTSTETIPTTEAKPAWALVTQARDLWKNSQAQDAVQAITQAQKTSGKDAAFFLHAGDVFAAAGEWPLAALMYLNLNALQGGSLPVEQANKLHEAAYRMGVDPQAIRVFMVTQDPLLDLGRVRFELNNGNTTTAQQEIDQVLADKSLVALFPEALLVAAELDIAQKSFQAADDSLNQLAAMPDLPAWIPPEADRLRGLAKP